MSKKTFFKTSGLLLMVWQLINVPHFQRCCSKNAIFSWFWFAFVDFLNYVRRPQSFLHKFLIFPKFSSQNSSCFLYDHGAYSRMTISNPPLRSSFTRAILMKRETKGVFFRCYHNCGYSNLAAWKINIKLTQA